MAKLPGLFKRNGIYYIRVVIPKSLRRRIGDSTKAVKSLHTADYHQARTSGAIQRAMFLAEFRQIALDRSDASQAVGLKSPVISMERPLLTGLSFGLIPESQIREVFKIWENSQARSKDSIAACSRAIEKYCLFSEVVSVPCITRSIGNDFRAWLLHSDRGTTSKTARDRFVWVKSILGFAANDLRIIPANPWEKLDISFGTTKKRRPWTLLELVKWFHQPLYRAYELPLNKKAGLEAAYWIPLIGLFTGARVGEIAQLQVADVSIQENINVFSITDEGEGQKVKTASGIRLVPVHSELVRLGFLEYVKSRKNAGDIQLWPMLPKRSGKPGGYFSQWFGMQKTKLELGTIPDFHCFRHTVRSQLAKKNTPESTIDAVIGHKSVGSVGARIYTHRSLEDLSQVIEQLDYPSLDLRKVFIR
ncbi:MAG: site-specific integrase [Pseudomonadota bacterium]